MKLHFILVLLTSVAAQVHALKCYDCYGYDYQEDYYKGECFNVNTIRYNCTGAKYCEITFRVEDGITTDVHRGCGYEEKKAGEGWHTDNSNSYSRFYKYCNETDVCNNDPISGFKTCTKECINGECDYILGVCACYSGYTGDICNTTDTSAPKIRKCHQCSSDYDGVACENEVTGEGSECLNGENHCSISRTTLFDNDMTAQKNVTVRGCTDSILPPSCAFHYIYFGSEFNTQYYLEYTCIETCNSDSCNQKLSGEVADNEGSDLYCVQCSGTDNCNTGPSLCPYGTKYCISNVVYTVEGRRYNEDYPDFALLSVVRGCTNESVVAECKEERVVGTNSVKKVTCSETCEKYGCNTGWPARPKCLYCDSEDGYSCVENPPLPELCEKPHQSYCYIHDETIKSTTGKTSGYAKRLVRDCSSYDRGNYCKTTRTDETEIVSCNRTCTTDGCNVGSGEEILLQSLLYVFPLALSANLLQNMN